MNITTHIRLESGMFISVNANYRQCPGDRVTPSSENLSINVIKSGRGHRVSIEAVAKHEGRPVWWIEDTIEQQITHY